MARYRGNTVEVILEEGSSDDSDDFIEQEARLNAEEQHGSNSRPKCEGEEQSNAYGEAMAILDQAALACDREFAINEFNLNKNEHMPSLDTKVTNSYRSDPSDDMVLPALANKTEENEEKFLSPSDSALQDSGQLFPCSICGRTFSQKALERHIKVCEKVGSKKRNVFDLSRKRLEGLDAVPPSKEPPKRKIVKPEDEFQQCPSCQRKFGDKAYDKHVKWCTEKARRMQTSPKKDLEALAKLQARTHYRPKTPSRKESTGSSPSRKASNTSMESNSPDFMSRSYTETPKRKSFSGTKSLGRSSGISFLKDLDHTKETQETNFIRASTGRGSIKRGPAPTKSSLLRLQKTSDIERNDRRSKTPNCPLHNPPMTPTLRRRAPSPSGSLYGRGAPSPSNSLYGSLPRRSPSINNNYSFQSLVKPSVVRPSRSNSYGMRREPEGIEHEKSYSRPSSAALMSGHYDHSQEYDPYQSAARQMQELLFGTKNSHNNPDDLKTSTNSAFQKYIPAANVPSTAELNNKLNLSPKRNPVNNSWSSRLEKSASKVAKFCHECGNAFAMPDIRFCCECGVKRLYC